MYLQYLLVVAFYCTATNTYALSPVVLVPGAAGSVLEGKLVGKPAVPHWWCYKDTSSWFRLWLDISSLLPFRLDCWNDNIRLEWDMETLTAHNPEGVLTRSPGFGDTSSIEVLDTLGLVKYFEPLTDFLVGLGYTKGTNVRAAPYDFRYSPDRIPGGYHEKLKALIEDTFERNGNQQVVLISHSFGCPVTLYFLTHIAEATWKQKYIRHWVSLSGIYGGTKQELEVLMSGYLEGIPNIVINRLKVRAQQRTNIVNLFMLPSDSAFDLDEVMVRTADRTYTLRQLDQLLIDAGFPEAVPMRKSIMSSKQLLATAPNVPVTCIYGNTPDSTAKLLTFGEGDFPDTPPQVERESGDGTVNLPSLQLCGKLATMQNETVNVHEIHGTDHNGVIAHPETLDFLNKLLDMSENN